jgi:hypothetical protein
MHYFLVALFLALSIQPILAEDGQGDWMTSYYKSPSPEKFVPEVRSMIRAGVLKFEHNQPPAVAFLSQVMATNPEMVPKWLEEFKDLDEKQQSIIWAAAWYSRTTEARKFFEDKSLDIYLEQPAPSILEMEVNNPAVLDMLWGYFMATGKEQPVRRIISAFDLSEYLGDVEGFRTSEKTERDKEKAYLGVTFKAAMWSLEQNCRQHPLVMQYCEGIYIDENLSQDQRLWLGVVLSKVKPEKYTLQPGRDENAEQGGKDGPAATSKYNLQVLKLRNPARVTVTTKDGFGGEVFLTANENIYAEWARPEMPRIDTIKELPVGRVMVLVVIYSNPAKDKDGNVNVTYDLEIIKPDGSVSEFLPDIVCLKGPLKGQADKLSLSQTQLKWVAEAADPPGLWKFKVVLKDNVRGTNLPLEASLKIVSSGEPE